MLQPRLFAPGHQQPPSPGCFCIFGGKFTLADHPAGMDVDILHHTNSLQLVREARIENQKKKVVCAGLLTCVSVCIFLSEQGRYTFFLMKIFGLQDLTEFFFRKHINIRTLF